MYGQQNLALPAFYLRPVNAYSASYGGAGYLAENNIDLLGGVIKSPNDLPEISGQASLNLPLNGIFRINGTAIYNINKIAWLGISAGRGNFQGTLDNFGLTGVGFQHKQTCLAFASGIAISKTIDFQIRGVLAEGQEDLANIKNNSYSYFIPDVAFLFHKEKLKGAIGLFNPLSSKLFVSTTQLGDSTFNVENGIFFGEQNRNFAVPTLINLVLQQTIKAGQVIIEPGLNVNYQVVNPVKEQKNLLISANCYFKYKNLTVNGGYTPLNLVIKSGQVNKFGAGIGYTNDNFSVIYSISSNYYFKNMLVHSVGITFTKKHK